MHREFYFFLKPAGHFVAKYFLVILPFTQVIDFVGAEVVAELVAIVDVVAETPEHVAEQAIPWLFDASPGLSADNEAYVLPETTDVNADVAIAEIPDVDIARRTVVAPFIGVVFTNVITPEPSARRRPAGTPPALFATST